MGLQTHLHLHSHSKDQPHCSVPFRSSGEWTYSVHRRTFAGYLEAAPKVPIAVSIMQCFGFFATSWPHVWPLMLGILETVAFSRVHSHYGLESTAPRTDITFWPLTPVST